MSEALNVLFLCTGNSARSILAEALLERSGQGRFKAFSAGSHPKGRIHPAALSLLTEMNHPTSHLRSKSWDEFARPGAPRIDFVITVCDDAAGEVCPVWPGRPVTAHWGMPDPAAVKGGDAEMSRAFATTYRSLSDRIAALAGLAAQTLDRPALIDRLNAIGRLEADSGTGAVE